MHFNSYDKYMLMNFTPDFRKARELAGLTQQQVATAVGISVRQYIKYENAEVAPKFTTFQKIVEVFADNVNDSSAKEIFKGISEMDNASLERFRELIRKGESGGQDFFYTSLDTKPVNKPKSLDRPSTDSFAKPFKEYIENGNFRLFEIRFDSQYGEFAENYLGERAINKEPFDFFAYVILLEDNKEVFGFVKKIDRDKWIVKEFKADDYPLRVIDPKLVKELWILRKHFMLHDVKPQIFEVNENANELRQDQNKES